MSNEFRKYCRIPKHCSLLNCDIKLKLGFSDSNKTPDIRQMGRFWGYLEPVEKCPRRMLI